MCFGMMTTLSTLFLSGSKGAAKKWESFVGPHTTEEEWLRLNLGSPNRSFIEIGEDGFGGPAQISKTGWGSLLQRTQK